MGLKISAIIFVIAGGIVGYQHYQLSVLRDNLLVVHGNNARLESAVNTQADTVNALENNLSATIENSRALAEQISANNAHQREITRQLNSYRGRLGDNAIHNPKAVETSVNNGTAGVMCEFATTTGGNISTCKGGAGNSPKASRD